MKRSTITDAAVDFFPQISGKNFPGGDCGIDEPGALFDHPARSKRVMSDFAVPHVIIAGKAHRGAVGFKYTGKR
jgi:hypothetical protein